MQKLSILIIDDDEDFARTLALVLEDDGHNVSCAQTTEQSVALHRAHRFDFVMIDVRLHAESGVTCFERLLAIDPDLRAVMMTGYSDEAALERALDAGARQVLRKPFSERELMQAVHSVD